MEKGFYIGTEFVERQDWEIEIQDDHSDENAPCYKIRFVGELEWIDNIDDEDIRFA